MDTETIAVVVWLQKELHQRLSSLANGISQSESFHCQKTLARYLEDVEDLYLAIDRLKNSGSERVSMEEAMRTLFGENV